MKRAGILLALIFIFCTFPANALHVTCVGTSLADHQAYLEGGVTWVQLRAVLDAYHLPVYWDGTAACADSLHIQPGLTYLQAGERYIPSARIRLENGSLWVPLRTLAAALGAEIHWDAQSGQADLYARQLQDKETFYDQNDLYWLSRIIHAEAQGESLDGMIAVGSVVIARMENGQFPNSIHDVIFDTTDGIQFTPVKNGTIYNTPSPESILAAKLVLEGARQAEGCLFFLDPRQSTSFWIPENRSFCISIGCHDFYY